MKVKKEGVKKKVWRTVVAYIVWFICFSELAVEVHCSKYLKVLLVL